MGNPLLSKKAFLYFGGAFILLLGGAIVIMAPYHHTGFIALPGDSANFEIWDKQGFYPRLRVSVMANPEDGNNTVYVTIRISNSSILDEDVILNITMTIADKPAPNALYEKRVWVDLEPGIYLIYIQSIVGAKDIDIALSQASDSRVFVVTGGIMNFIGLAMGGIGYCLKGSVIPTGDEAIIEWGYEEHDQQN